MAADLMRKSVGLTEAHKQLIRLLAERAVEDYLAETDSADTVASSQPSEEAVTR